MPWACHPPASTAIASMLWAYHPADLPGLTRLTIERRTKQHLRPARRSRPARAMHAEPQRAVVAVVDQRHEIAACAALRQGHNAVLQGHRIDSGGSDGGSLGQPGPDLLG